MRYGPWPQSGRLLRHLCFASSFLRCPDPGGSGHVKGALAHRAQRGLPWTWPRKDYLALLEEEEKAPQQPAAACGCQGPATAMVPRCHGWRSGEGARAGPQCPAAHSPASKRPFDLQRSAATCEGGGGTLPPRCTPAHARVSSGTSVRLLSPGTRNACTEVRLARPPALAGCQTAVAVLLVRAAHPVLASSQRHARHQDHLPLLLRSAHAPVPGAASRSAAIGKPSWGMRGERKQPHVQSAAAPVPTAVPPRGRR